jgi:hypothetical protein
MVACGRDENSAKIRGLFFNLQQAAGQTHALA